MPCASTIGALARVVRDPVRGKPRRSGRSRTATTARLSNLNKSILDQGWFEFRRQLDYKLAWQGGWLVAVLPQYTSRECGFEENANVLRAGHARFACDAASSRNPPKRLRGGSTPRLSAVGISGLQAGEDVKHSLKKTGEIAGVQEELSLPGQKNRRQQALRGGRISS